MDPQAKQFFDAMKSDVVDGVNSLVTRMRRTSWQAYALPIGCLFLFWVALPVGCRFVYGDEGETHYQELLREFQVLEPFPGANEAKKINSFSRWKPRQALVGTSYNTPASYSQLRYFYDEQLRSKGWHFAGERPIRKWGEDVGAWGAEYCKGDLAASLDYGSRVNSGYTFSLSLSWGLSQKCN